MHLLSALRTARRLPSASALKTGSRHTLTIALLGAVATLLCVPASALAQGVVFTPSVNTFAGTGAPSFSGDGAQATAATLNAPEGLAFDKRGNVYIADYNNNRIRIVSPTGVISTLAGTGTQCPNPTATTGACGDGGAASSATFYNPTQMLFDASGNLYIADYSDNRVRKITATNGVVTGASIITTVAGNGSMAESGNGGQATLAGLYLPHGIALDSAGNLYIQDQVGCTVRKVTLATGIITLFAGNGTCGYAGDGGQANAAGAEIKFAVEIAFDTAGNLYIADRGNNVIRKVTASTNVISTYAGINGTTCNPSTAGCGDGGAATMANLTGPAGVSFDSANNLIIADADGSRIRRVTPAGVISTIAGTGTACNTNGTTSGPCGDGGAATKATFSFPINVSLGQQGNIFFTDQYANRVRYYSPAYVFPATQVGVASPAQNVLFTTTGTGNTIITSITVPNDPNGMPEFTVGTLSGCTLGGAGNATGTLCTIPVTFNPAYPGLQTEPIIVVTNGGTFQVGLSGIGLAPQAILLPGTLSTVAGTGVTGSTGNGGAATAATFNGARQITFDYAGNYYIGDIFNNQIRQVNTAGIISTVAGGGTTNYVTTAGTAATSAQLAQAQQVVFDAAGNMYLADYNNYVVSKVDAVTKKISVIAGNGTQGNTGDGGVATSAQFIGPAALAINPTTGNLYVVDSLAHSVRLINVGTGLISTVAGNGVACSSSTAACGDGGLASTAQFNRPNGIALDRNGNLFIADTLDNRIRRIDGTTGIITTIAGTGAASYSGDGAAATSATLNSPFQVTLDAAGDVFFADSANSVVRMISASTGKISTIIGTNTACITTPSPACGDGGPSNVSALSNPTGVGLDTAGNIYTVENGTNRVRRATVNPAALVFPTTVVGSTTGPLFATLEDIGNQTLSVNIPGAGTNPSVSANFSLSPTSTTCPMLTTTSTSTGSLASGASCLFGVNFVPTMAGTNTGSLIETDNSLNATASTQTVSLTGPATMEAATVAIASSVNPSTYGQSTTFTATVSGGGVAPTGTVTFSYVSNGTTITLGTGTISTTNGVSTATLATGVLPAGAQNVTATYNADANYSTGNASLTQTVNKVATTDTLTTSNATPNYGSPVTLTYTVPPVTGAAAPPTGTVTFTTVSNGTTITLGTGTISTTNGVSTATLTTSNLPQGSDTVTGSYAGDTNYLAESATVGETVKPVASATNSTITPTTAVAVAGSSVTLTVTVKDTTSGGGQPVAGAAVSFSSSSTNAMFSTPAVTNASGVTTVTITDTVAEAVTVTATATPSGGSGVAISTQPVITFVAPAYVVTVLNDPTVNPAACVDPNISTSGNTGCSLRDAVAAANLLTGVTTPITLPTTGTITLTQATAVPVMTPVVITGPGANALTISGGGNVPIFSVAAGPSTITGVTLLNGSGATTGGGAVNITAGNLTLNADAVNNNAGQGPGGGVLNSGTGTLTVSNTTFASNVSTSGNGGAIANTGGGKVVVYNSTFYGNVAPGGNGGAIATNGMLTASNDTFASDSAVNGGAIYASGSATSAVALSIFTANKATTNGAGIAAVSTTLNSTSNNYYQNTTNGTEDDCNSCTTNATPVTGNPNLAPLGNYGGTTLTMLPLPASSAICSGTAPTLITPTFTSDQRGVAFGSENGTTGCYPVGAVETNYSISFTTATSSVQAGSVMAPSPVVTVVENGISLVGGTATLPVTDSQTDLAAGSTTTATSSTAAATAGQAAYTNLKFTNIESSDTLTATLSLNPALTTPLKLTTTSTFAVTAATNTITFPALSDTPISSTAPTPMATSTAGGTITYASTTPSVCTVSGSTITDIAVGTCTITANQAATGNYAAAAQQTQSYQVTKGSSGDTLTTTNASPAYGSSVTLTFNVPLAAGIAPTGTVTFTTVSNGTTITLGTATVNASGVATLVTTALPVGSDTVTGTYPGDSTYSAGTATVSETVAKSTPTVTETSSVNPSTYGQSTTLTATVSGAGATPTGTVTFTTVSNGTTITLGTATVNASGVATLATTALPGGSEVVMATYNADTNYLTANNSLTQTVNKVATTDTLSTSNASPTFGSPVTLTYTVPPVTGASAPPTGIVTFTTVSNGTTITLGTGTISTTNGVSTATLTTSALPSGSQIVTGSYAGDTNYAAATATVGETVGKATSTDTLTTSNASPVFGSSVTLTYTAPAVNGTYPTGTVTFTTVSGGQTITLGTGTLNASGVATLMTSALPVGSDTVTGSYAGDTNFLADTATVAENVGKSTTADTLATSNATPTAGTPVTLTYTVPVVNGVVPTGTVTLTTVSNGTTITLGSGTPNASGVVIVTTTALPVGSDTVTGSYPGDANYAAGSATVAETVGPAASTGDTLTANPTSPTAGTTVTLTFQVPIVNGVIPTGMVTFTSGGQTFGPVTLDSTGKATVTTSTLPVGSDTVTANYPGDANYAAGSATTTVTVGPAVSSNDTVTANPSTTTAGTAVTLTFTVPVVNGKAPTGTVTFTSGGQTLGTATVSSTGVATITTSTLPVGTDTVTAAYPGDTNYAAGSPTTTVTVGPAASSSDTVTVSPANPTLGSPATLTFQVPLVNGKVPTGTVTFTVGGQTFGPVTVDATGKATVTTTQLPGGTNTVTASYTGDANYAAGSPTTTVTVGPAASTGDTLTTSNANPTYGTAVTLTFTVPLVNGVVPTGTVTFTNGTTVLGTGAINASGVATLSTSALPVGSDAIKATYPGDSNYAAGSASLTETVAPASSNTDTLTSSNLSPAAGTPVTLTFTVPLTNGTAPTGTVTFTNGTTVLGTATISASGVATLTTSTLPVGTDTVKASYPGDSTYAAGSATVTETVGPAPNTNDTFTSSPANPTAGSPVTLTFTVPLVNGVVPTGTVSFYNGTTLLGTGTINAQGVATLITSALPAGSDTVKAVYPGDANYASATLTTSITVGPAASGSDTLTTTNATPAFGSPVTLTFTVPLVSGAVPTGTVTFTNGTTVLGTGNISASGIATLTTSALPVGTDTVKATFPGDNNYAAGSATVVETVSPASSTGDTLAINPTSPTAGTPTTLTFMVPLVNGVAPTGTVSFYNGTTLLGTATINAQGIATLTTSALPAGSDTIKAVYTGDSNYAAGSATLSVTVAPAASGNDTLTTSNANPTAGTPVTLTFTVPPVNGVAPTGTVTFTTVSNGMTVNLGTASVNAAGVATLITSALPAGSDTVTGSYPGDNNYAAGSATVAETVAPAISTSDTLTASPASPAFGSPVTLSFTVPLVNGVAPTGTVSFYNGTTLLGTGTINAQGVATLITSALPAGMDSVRATYPGDANYAAGSAMATVTVSPAPSTGDTLTTSNPTPSFGSPVTFTFTVPLVNGTAPTGTVSFYNGTTLLGTGMVNAAGVATLTTSALPGGSDTVKAVYPGDANYAASSLSVNETVAPAPATGDTLTASPTAPTEGTPVTLTFTVPLVNGVAPTGTVSFYNGTTLLGTATINAQGVATLTTSALPAGSDTIKATYPGDANYAAASQTTTLTVGPAAATGDTLTTSNPTPTFGSPVTLTFTVPLVNGMTPTGTVTFTTVSGGATITLGTATVNASGVATLTTSALPGGTDVVKAAYSGDSNYAPAAPTVTETVAPAAAANDTFTVNPPATTFGQAVVLTFTVPSVNGIVPTGSVSFYNGTALLGTGTINAQGVATFSTSALPVGTDALKAVYTGDSSYATSTLAGSELVTKADAASGVQKLTSSTPTTIVGQPVTLTYTVPPVNGVAPTGTVSFYNGVTLLGTGTLSANGTATLTTSALPQGVLTVTANYPGDATYASGTASLTQVVTMQDFSISATAPQTINPGQSVTYGVSLSGVNTAFTAPVTLTATGLPADATVTFATPTYVPGVGPTSTTMTIVTSPNHAELQRFGNTSGIAYGLLLLPLLGLRRIRRKLRQLPRGLSFCLAALAMLAGLTAVTGCGGGYFGPQPRTYTITVTGTSGTLQHSTTVTLTIE